MFPVPHADAEGITVCDSNFVTPRVPLSIYTRKVVVNISNTRLLAVQHRHRARAGCHDVRTMRPIWIMFDSFARREEHLSRA